MHLIEPYYRWREYYIASDDEYSPFFGREYSEFYFENKIYNFLIHPQWDNFGSETLYLKILYVHYDEGFAILELIGEWNDTLHNDIMILKEQVLEVLFEEGIRHFILICENVLNFHASDDCYYEDWKADLEEVGGWFCLLNILEHVQDELQDHGIDQHCLFGEPFNELIWRPHKPQHVYAEVLRRVEELDQEIYYLD